MGFITTKVKADGRLFLASIDKGVDGNDFRDPLPPLDPKKIYWGHLMEGSAVHQSPWVEYAEVGSADFKGEELENTPGEFRLVKF